eukprot:gene15608-biopygen23203
MGADGMVRALGGRIHGLATAQNRAAPRPCGPPWFGRPPPPVWAGSTVTLQGLASLQPSSLAGKGAARRSTGGETMKSWLRRLRPYGTPPLMDYPWADVHNQRRSCLVVAQQRMSFESPGPAPVGEKMHMPNSPAPRLPHGGQVVSIRSLRRVPGWNCGNGR